jgi:hypothetical protein
MRRKKNFEIEGSVLLRNTKADGTELQQVVAPESMKGLIMKSLHDNLGHPGREKTAWLVKQILYWVGMDSYIRDKVEQCGRCIMSKTREQPRSELVNIMTSRPMELVCIYFVNRKVQRKHQGYFSDDGSFH